jgi:hypothetical protein
VVCAPVEGKKEPTMLASTDENQDDLQHPNMTFLAIVIDYVRLIVMTRFMYAFDDAHNVFDGLASVPRIRMEGCLLWPTA